MNYRKIVYGMGPVSREFDLDVLVALWKSYELNRRQFSAAILCAVEETPIVIECADDASWVVGLLEQMNLAAAGELPRDESSRMFYEAIK